MNRLKMINVAIRLVEIAITINIRRDSISDAKEFEKEKAISEDELHRAQDEIQKITDRYIQKVDELIDKKEKEVLEV